jgi:peptidoglycan/xylan/chitin deacetylase (PgdA/CDA1 family)
MKKIVLTIDDRLIYNYTTIAPILRQYGFRCTFFVTAKPNIWKDLRGFEDMSWEQCVELHQDGFEIANHTHAHFPITCGIQKFKEEIIKMDNFFEELGITKPISFAYPGYLHDPSLSVVGQKFLKELGFKFARVGYPVDQWHYNLSKREYTPYFDPKNNNPLEIVTTGILNKDYTIEHFKKDCDGIPDEYAAIFATHYAQSPYEINRLHQICRYVRDQEDLQMCLLRDLKC